MSTATATLTATTTQNPVISQSGTANITGGGVCSWNTKNGSSSTITISNTGSNTLQLTIAGAPNGIQAFVEGKAVDNLNSLFFIPPNTPTYTVIGFGDFKGQTVSIQNLTPTGSDGGTDTTAQIVCVVQG